MAFNIMRTYKHEETEVDRLVLTTDENTTLLQLLLLFVSSFVLNLSRIYFFVFLFLKLFFKHCQLVFGKVKCVLSRSADETEIFFAMWVVFFVASFSRARQTR